MNDYQLDMMTKRRKSLIALSVSIRVLTSFYLLHNYIGQVNKNAHLYSHRCNQEASQHCLA